MRAVLFVVLIGVTLLGCPEDRPALPAPVDAGSPEVIIDAGPVDAGPSSLDPVVTAAWADGGSAIVTAQAEIEPATSLTVALPTSLKDFRIRLLDFREQVVASDDELSADGRTYRIVPTQPLQTGRRYSLQLDAELGPVVTDTAGATFEDWQLEFRVTGEVVPEKPAAPAPKRKKKK